MSAPTDEEVAAGAAAVRSKINASGYGAWVSDAQCEEVARAVLEAVEELRGQAQ